MEENLKFIRADLVEIFEDAGVPDDEVAALAENIITQIREVAERYK